VRAVPRAVPSEYSIRWRDKVRVPELEIVSAEERDCDCRYIFKVLPTNVELGQRSFIVNHLYYRSGTGQHAEVQEAKDTDCLALTT
jgi:hypothetical protein